MPENKNYLETAEWDRGEAQQIIARSAALKGGLMEALHGLQDGFGYIPAESHALLADAFNLSQAEVYGVMSFYHDFRRQPAGRHVIEICQAESCQARGSRTLTAHAQDLLGIKMGQTTPDGHFTLKAVYCLGNCAVSPNITMDGRLYGRVGKDHFEALLKAVTS
ncbi:NAD-dependent formate dehydrogenase gamma subunit [hydrothermal vent metagenome]|uniref:NAD-dependent formate dehydrogenase gamma subunit n=1 Tax=hydrothermal vent metagenome TaxID=652676 RepID=A0A3B0RZ92_9ZZZZ